MTPEQLDRVFGRGRLQMKTGRHVEVFREAATAGERRRYTKRFLATDDGDFRAWTEREWRILARLIGHGVGCVPDVVQFDRGAGGGAALVQTFDAGITVDHWATLLPVERDGRLRQHVFEDCAHWWALARHSLLALDQIHRLQLVHLDVKADNVCIPYAPADFEPTRAGQSVRPLFAELALIDFAFSVVTGEDLTMPLPIGWQRDYAYQSPRLLQALEAGRAGDLGPTRALDWRCDIFSLAAMLERYLPAAGAAREADGWTPPRLVQARALLHRLREVHDRSEPHDHPHPVLAQFCRQVLTEPDLADSLQRGWTLALAAPVGPVATAPTPVTRLAPPVFLDQGHVLPQRGPGPADDAPAGPPAAKPVVPSPGGRRLKRLLWPALALVALVTTGPPLVEAVRSMFTPAQAEKELSPRRPAALAARSNETFEQRARRLLGRHLPDIAEKMERDVEVVLRAAARSEHAREDRRVLNLARELPSFEDLRFGGTDAPADARRLNEEARQAFWMRRSVGEAFQLQLRAFGANPRDTEIVGNLAFLHLKLMPPQAENARRLALYALSLGRAQFPVGRSEDWGTLAVANALLGREQEARDALFVMLAAGRDVERACRAALSAAANYGEAVRAPAEALLQRVERRGGSAGPACQWPPNWRLGSRFP